MQNFYYKSYYCDSVFYLFLLNQIVWISLHDPGIELKPTR